MLLLNEKTNEVIHALVEAGAKPYLVGGFVRDYILGLPNKDIDIEVFNIHKKQLEEILSQFGELNPVGESFGIYKLDMRNIGGDELDISLPRTENKVGAGHKGFVVESDGFLTPEEASLRRDFTFNSMFMDADTGEIFDPHGGLIALQNKQITPTSEHFLEDPLRVLRAMQFAARFDFDISEICKNACRKMLLEFKHLAIERVNQEFIKMMVKGIKPSKGMLTLLDTYWIIPFDELLCLIGIPQDEQWHPEGDVWEHTLQVMDAGAIIAEREQLDDHKRLILLLACMCHDLGKTSTTTITSDGHWMSYGHCEAGVPLTESLLKKMGFQESIIEEVKPLVALHLRHLNGSSKRAVRRLSLDVQPSTIEMLGWLVEADHSGRGEMPKGMPEKMQNVLDMAENLAIQNNGLKPILMGRHLIELGVKPGEQMGLILKKAFEAQVEGEFEDLENAINWYKEQEAKNVN